MIVDWNEGYNFRIRYTFWTRRNSAAWIFFHGSIYYQTQRFHSPSLYCRMATLDMLALVLVVNAWIYIVFSRETPSGLTLAKGCFSELAQALARASPDTRDAAVQLLADLFSTGKLKSSEICALLLNAEERARISKITDQNIDSMGSLAVDYEHMHVDQQQRLVRIPSGSFPFLSGIQSEIHKRACCCRFWCRSIIQ